LLGIGNAAAQVDCPQFSGGGSVHADGAILALEQFAIGPSANAGDALEQGAVPCWIAVGACPGDLDGDGYVDLEDLATLLAHFGTPSGAAPEDGDTDGDSDVDLSDLATRLAAFGANCS
jgi:hypothetical protein